MTNASIVYRLEDKTDAVYFGQGARVVDRRHYHDAARITADPTQYAACRAVARMLADIGAPCACATCGRSYSLGAGWRLDLFAAADHATFCGPLRKEI